jgi:hypothetical protein
MRIRRTVALVICVAVLVIASIACGGGAGPAGVETPTSPPETAAEAPAEHTEWALTGTPVEAKEGRAPSQTKHDTVFPLPDDVRNFVGEGGESMVNFQTGLGLEEVVDFYRRAFVGQGLTEREILTVVDDAAFSMVFDGTADGKALVIQGVDLGETTNVNIRFEDV